MKEVTIHIRLSKIEKRLMKLFAKNSGMSVTDFIRFKCLQIIDSKQIKEN